MTIALYQKAKKQELLNKYAKNFAADKHKNRDIFKGIRYSENGNAYVSDTHVLLRMKDVSPFNEPHTLHAVTGAELEGVYPSEDALESLLNWTSENRIILETHEQIAAVTTYAKIAQMVEKELSPKLKMVNLVLTLKGAFLQVTEQEVELNALIGFPAKEQVETWAFNADYIYNAMNLFKSAGTKGLVIKFKSTSCEPIILSDDENGIDVLILPTRTNAEVRDER